MAAKTHGRIQILTLTALLAAVATSASGVSAQDASAPAGPEQCRATEGDIGIGVTGPQSGLYSIVGDSQEAGLQLAIEDLGDAGVNGRKVVMYSKDDEFSPTVAVNNFQEFYDVNKICAMVGPTDTSSTFAVADAIASLPDGPIPQVGVLGTDDVLNPDGPGTAPRPYTFAVLTGNWPILTILTNYVLANHAGKKIGIIHDPTAYGQNQRDFTLRLLSEQGITPVAVEALPVNTADPSNQVNKVLDAGAEVVYALVSFDDVARVAKAIRARGSDAQIICTDQCAVIPDFIKNAGDAAEGVVTTRVAGTALPPTPELQAFSDRYNKLTGYTSFPPPDWALATYDTANILFDIWSRVGTEPANVFSEFEKVQDYKGLACSNLSFSPTQHNGLGEPDCYRLMVIKDGKPVVMEGQN